LSEPIKHKPFPKGDEKYYFVFSLGTVEKGRGKGLCSVIVRHYQEIAEREQRPTHPEAANDNSWKLYKKLGFVTLGEIAIGRGKHAERRDVESWGPWILYLADDLETCKESQNSSTQVKKGIIKLFITYIL
jgi:hypothetical protein